MSGRPWTQTADGVMLDVRLTPRGARDAIVGDERRADGRTVLKARVRAAPVEGDANAALRRLIAKELGISPRQVEFAGGATARLKRLRIAGDPQVLATSLERFMKESAKVTT